MNLFFTSPQPDAEGPEICSFMNGGKSPSTRGQKRPPKDSIREVECESKIEREIEGDKTGRKKTTTSMYNRKSIQAERKQTCDNLDERN